MFVPNSSFTFTVFQFLYPTWIPTHSSNSVRAQKHVEHHQFRYMDSLPHNVTRAVPNSAFILKSYTILFDFYTSPSRRATQCHNRRLQNLNIGVSRRPTILPTLCYLYMCDKGDYYEETYPNSSSSRLGLSWLSRIHLFVSHFYETETFCTLHPRFLS